MTREDKNTMISLLRKETGMGCIDLSKTIDTFLEALKRKPHKPCDVGLRMKIEWEMYPLRKQPTIPHTNMSTMYTSKHEEITPYSKKRTGKLASIKFNTGQVE